MMSFSSAKMSRGSQTTPIPNKQLSYRRETVLQGGSVLVKSGRRYSADNIRPREIVVLPVICRATQAANNTVPDHVTLSLLLPDRKTEKLGENVAFL